jgi:phage gp36-like protein
LYSTKSDILNYLSDVELAQLTSESGNVIDDVVVGKAIAGADSIIDSYLGKKFSVPLATTPPIVNQKSTMIAIYNLYSRRAGQTAMNETVEKNYNDAIKWLAAAAEGDVSIGEDPPPAAPSPGGSKFKANDRTFTKESLKGM